MDTLAFGYILPTTGRIRDFNLLETCAAGRTRKSRITFSVSCLGMPLVGGGIFSFLMGYQFDKLEFSNAKGNI
jgi:hypothetical protein